MILACTASVGAEEGGAPGRTAEDALASFDLQAGFTMQLVAAEPLVVDPVAMVYDENGRAYVVEMRDYPHVDKAADIPYSDQDAQQPLGRIRLLEDSDGDGQMDQSHVFADQLSWPSGIALWKGGLFVAATPDIWYLKDTDGDRKADICQKVFTGFHKFNVQAVINNFQWGLDHRIYAAGSSNGGQIEHVGDDEPATPLLRRDFCLDPRTEQFEILSGGARFGNTFDDWGNRFLCNIRNPCQHVVLPNRYLGRNRYLPVPAVLHDAAASGEQIKVYPISPPEKWRQDRAGIRLADQNFNHRQDTFTRGYVTSSSGVTVYRGSAYPEGFQGNVFTAEVAWNLCSRRTLEPDGVTFQCERPDQQTDFLRSRDNWFRPVNFVNAPDGTLHVLDMHREVIEHPWSVPEEIKAKLDFRSGSDKGRIYRIVPPGYKVPAPPRLGEASTAELVQFLASPNGWHRETAHRLLYERQDLSAEKPLRTMLRESDFPLARLHAMWTLEGLDSLRDADLQVALNDAEPRLRAHAVRLAETRFAQSEALRQAVLALAGDDDSRVRFQVAFSLGEMKDAARVDRLHAIARQDISDDWIRVAVLSSIKDDSTELLEKLLADAAFVGHDASGKWLSQLARTAGGMQAWDAVAPLLTATESVDRSTRFAVVTGLGDGLRSHRIPLGKVVAEDREASRQLTKLFQEAADAAANDELTIPVRSEAIELLAHQNSETSREVLLPLLSGSNPSAIQIAALQALGTFEDVALAGSMVDAWPSLTPASRDTLIGVLMSRPAWTERLMTALEKGRIPPGQVSPTYRFRLLERSAPDVQARASVLLKGQQAGPRSEVLADYQKSLQLDGDQTRGQVVFTKICAACHRFQGQGHDIGPPLATVQHRTPENLMVNILDPNREVSPEFLEYMVLTDDGLSTSGVVQSESAASITLRRPGNQEETILRQRIEEMQSTDKSIMPEGLEKQISPQQMADLIAYLLAHDEEN